MPAPRRHLSVDELTQRASTGLNIRRGIVKISEPIPSSYVHNGEIDQGHVQRTPQLEGTWLSNSSTNEGSYSRNTPAHVSRFTERTSLGPSLATTNMSSFPSNEISPNRRPTGLRATIRRVFGSKKGKGTTTKATPPEDVGTVLSMAGPNPDYNSLSPPAASSFQYRALHSHAPSPHIRVESADVIRQELHVAHVGPRRNTVPDLMLLPLGHATEGQHRSLTTLAPPQRPKTAIRQPVDLSSQPNRRSRSTDGLVDFSSLGATSTGNRDRTQEIAYWRRSIVVDPLPSLSTPALGVSGEEQSLRSSSGSRPSLEPIQDFDFGLHDTPRPSGASTLVDRVNTLEVKLFDFEYAISKLQGTDVGNIDDSINSCGAQLKQSTPTDSQKHTSSRRQIDDAQRREESVDRHSKATTIKAPGQRLTPGHSRARSSVSLKLTRDQYERLCQMIRDESTARRHLETQLIKLQKEVDMLKSPAFNSQYLTPSPDSYNNSNALITPRGVQRFPLEMPDGSLHQTSRFSMTETDSEIEIDSVHEEVYNTPQEQTFRAEHQRYRQIAMI